MPTPTVPTGSAMISMSNNIKPAFAGQKGFSLGNYRGSHPSLPTVGQSISFGSFRGLTAATPSLTLAAVAGANNLSVDAAGAFTGKVSSGQVGALSYSSSRTRPTAAARTRTRSRPARCRPASR